MFKNKLLFHAFSGVFLAFILGAKSPTKTGLATEGLRLCIRYHVIVLGSCGLWSSVSFSAHPVTLADSIASPGKRFSITSCRLCNDCSRIKGISSCNSPIPSFPEEFLSKP